MMRALEPRQRDRATIASVLPSELFAAAFRDNLELGYQGISWNELSDHQQRLLEDLIGTYVGRMRSGHAEVKLAEVKRHLSDTWFADRGLGRRSEPLLLPCPRPGRSDRVRSPGAGRAEGPARTRNHIHTLVRTPNGNDYGTDLLRQHYERYDHSHPDTPHRRGEI